MDQNHSQFTHPPQNAPETFNAPAENVVESKRATNDRELWPTIGDPDAIR
jgi:hypothetical protein